MEQLNSSMKTQHIPLHHTHTPPTLTLKLCQVMLCNLASSHCLTSKRYSNERFLFISFYFCSLPLIHFLSQLGTFSLQCNYLFSQHS
jgi:hypothetical protein